MKCFKCDAMCITVYLDADNKPASDKIVAVAKFCTECGWQSYPTKLPEKIN